MAPDIPTILVTIPFRICDLPDGYMKK